MYHVIIIIYLLIIYKEKKRKIKQKKAKSQENMGFRVFYKKKKLEIEKILNSHWYSKKYQYLVIINNNRVI